MKSLVFFNNKGGVGKTTLTCNVVSYLNMNMGKRVLQIDADPQCNATQAILSEEECSNIYLRARRGRAATASVAQSQRPCWRVPDANAYWRSWRRSRSAVRRDIHRGGTRYGTVPGLVIWIEEFLQFVRP